MRFAYNAQLFKNKVAFKSSMLHSLQLLIMIISVALNFILVTQAGYLGRRYEQATDGRMRQYKCHTDLGAKSTILHLARVCVHANAKGKK